MSSFKVWKFVKLKVQGQMFVCSEAEARLGGQESVWWWVPNSLAVAH